MVSNKFDCYHTNLVTYGRALGTLYFLYVFSPSFYKRVSVSHWTDHRVLRVMLVLNIINVVAVLYQVGYMPSS